MKVQEVKRMVKLKEWATQMTAYKQSGLTVKQWCNENGVKLKTFYNHMRAVREELLEIAATKGTEIDARTKGIGIDSTNVQKNCGGISDKKFTGLSDKPVFTALPVPQPKQSAAVSVRIGDYAVDIHDGADSITVEQVIRLVARL